MAKSGPVSSELTKRYALALIDLAQENKTLSKVEKDLESLQTVLSESDDFLFFVKSASIDSASRLAVLDDVAKKGKFQTETTNFLKVVSKNGRLSVLPEILTGIQKQLASMRGEMVATVESAYS